MYAFRCNRGALLATGFRFRYVGTAALRARHASIALSARGCCRPMATVSATTSPSPDQIWAEIEEMFAVNGDTNYGA